MEEAGAEDLDGIVSFSFADCRPYGRRVERHACTRARSRVPWTAGNMASRGCTCQDPNDELYAVAPTRPRKMISFDWAAGYVSPYRCTDDDRADTIMQRVGECDSPPVCCAGTGNFYDGSDVALLPLSAQGCSRRVLWWIWALETEHCSLLLPSEAHTPSATSFRGQRSRTDLG